MPSGWNDDFPSDVIYDVAVLSHEVTAVQVAIGVSRGGFIFAKNEEWRNPPFDGRRQKTAGMDRRVDADPTFEGMLLQVDDDVLAYIEHGSTASAPAANSTTITPVDSSTTIAAAQLLLKPRLTWRRGNGGTFVVELDYGFVERWGLGAQDKNEGEFSALISGRLDPSAGANTTDTPCWRYIITGADIV